MTPAGELTDQQLAMLRLVNAGGIVAGQRLALLLGPRVLFKDNDVGACLRSLTGIGLIESLVPDMFSMTEAGTEKLRESIQNRRRHISEALKGELWAEFEALDKDLKRVCSAWQTKEDRGCLNVHDDPEYDFVIVDKLANVHDRLKALIQKIDGWERELRDLLPELDSALCKVNEGEFEYFTGVDVCSYHNLWFELHEDLLCTIGLERSE